ncbi:MAG: XRE family transcriptional regulator [Ruminococcus sp.]|nr:XRE family transcriptional regulator [Ruminococcus sp.]
MDKKEFKGERLKVARLFRGMTLTELSTITGISKQSISLYENDKNKPDYEKISLISSALHIPHDFFLQEDICKTKTEVTYFRSLSSATKIDRTAQSLKLEFVAKMYEILSKYIDFPQLNIPTFDFHGSDDEFDNQKNEAMFQEIENIAKQVREFWGLGNEPIKDIQFLLEENGIIVTGFDTKEEKIDAFSQHVVLDNKDFYFVCVDQGAKPEGRISFDLAHELGHILLHPWSENLELVSKEEFKNREIQANMFASAFLLPADSFGKDIQAYPTDWKYYQWLKKKWKVSMQAMAYRCRELGIITSNQFQYMMRQLSKKGWRTKEPDDVPYYLHDNIFQGAIDLLKEEKILSSNSIIQTFKRYGVSMYPTDIENLLGLRKGTLDIAEDTPRIIQIKSYLDN